MKTIPNKISHFMLEEIFEQTRVIENILEQWVDFESNKIIFPPIDKKKGWLSRIKRIIFLGCGSSANASLLGNYYFEEFSGLNCEYEYADEFLSRRAIIERGTAVVLLSQSGKTKDIIKSAQLAKKKGAFIIGITNNPGSQLDRLSDLCLDTHAGQENALAATKSFSSQILILLLMSLYFSELKQKKIPNSKELYQSLKKLPKYIEKTLDENIKIKSLSAKFIKSNNLLVTGRHYNLPIALEGAHKIKETAYLHAEGVASEELRHGGQAMLDKNFPVISLLPSDKVYKDNIVLLKELKKAGAPVYLVSDKRNKSLDDLSEYIIKIPKTIPSLSVFTTLIPLQLIAYHLAVAKKIDVNKPRNIKKFVA